MLFGKCFFGHKWSKWTQYEQPMIYNNRRNNLQYEYVEDRQKRVCLECGFMQDVKIQ